MREHVDALGSSAQDVNVKRCTHFAPTLHRSSPKSGVNSVFICCAATHCCRRTRASLIPHQEVLESKAFLVYTIYIDATVDITVRWRVMRSNGKNVPAWEKDSLICGLCSADKLTYVLVRMYVMR